MKYFFCRQSVFCFYGGLLFLTFCCVQFCKLLLFCFGLGNGNGIANATSGIILSEVLGLEILLLLGVLFNQPCQ